MPKLSLKALFEDLEGVEPESLEKPSQAYPARPQTDIESLCGALGALRVLYLVHQNAHWQTKGPTFYSDHLMFQRLYESAASDADKLAERIVGMFGSEKLDLMSQALYMNECLGYATTDKDLVSRGIKAEIKAMELLEQAYYTCQSAQNLTIGMDDLLMEISSRREDSLYLLRQKTGQ